LSALPLSFSRLSRGRFPPMYRRPEAGACLMAPPTICNCGRRGPSLQPVRVWLLAQSYCGRITEPRCFSNRSVPVSSPASDDRRAAVNDKASRILMIFAAFLSGLVLFFVAILFVTGRTSSIGSAAATVGGPFRLEDQ